MKTTVVSLFATLAIAVTAMASPDDKKLPQATQPEPPSVVVMELNPKLDGKEVTMTFEVRDTHLISGGVPVGAFPSFGITPALKDKSPRFSVLVSGDLANLMDRFGMRTPSNAVKGRVIQATGTITVFPAPKNAANQGPSYQLNIRDWKRFRMVPSP